MNGIVLALNGLAVSSLSLVREKQVFLLKKSGN